MAKITREEGVTLLGELKRKLKETTAKDAILEILALAGSSVGYAPAFRALVMDADPEHAIKWE